MTRKREDLKVRVTYETNRFSDTNLVDAYEILTPPIRFTFSESSEPSHGERVETIQKSSFTGEKV